VKLFSYLADRYKIKYRKYRLSLLKMM